MQGARPFWFKGSFTPRISRYTRFIAQPRINHRRLCLLLFIPNLSSYPFPSRFCFLFLSYSFSSSFSSSSSLRARSSEILTRCCCCRRCATRSPWIGSSFRFFIVRILLFRLSPSRRPPLCPPLSASLNRGFYKD